jgi:hypothetical protein
MSAAKAPLVAAISPNAAVAKTAFLFIVTSTDLRHPQAAKIEIFTTSYRDF